MSFSIIIPTLNEEENVRPLLRRLEKMSSAQRFTPEIIFVDDDSQDLTCEMIRSYSGSLDVHIIERKKEKGLAGAVVTGAQAATYDYLIVMDADLSHQPEQIPSLIKPLMAGGKDMVIGSRYLENDSIKLWPIGRRIASLIASFPARLLTGIKDPLSGFFAIRTDCLKKLPTNIPGFKIGLELLTSQNAEFNVVEVPITFANRANGGSKISTAVISSYLTQLCRISRLSVPGISLLSIFGLGFAAVILDIGLIFLLSATGQPPATSHIFSYLLALNSSYLAFYFLNKSDRSQNSTQYQDNSYWRFLFFITAVLFLRGGIMALLIPDLSHTTVNLLVLVTLTTVTAWILAIPVFLKSYIFRQKKFEWQPLVFLLVIYTICLRLLYMGSAELIQEEAYYWNYAQHMDWGFLDHPPGVAVLITLGTWLFGTTEFGVRFGAILCWALTAAFVWGYTRAVFDRHIALMSLVFTATLPMFFGTSLLMTPDAPLLTCWAGSLFFFQRALIQHKRYSWIGGGVCLGLGLFSKYTIAFLGPSLIFFMIIDPHARKYFLSPWPYFSALLALLIFSPVIWWNLSNGWASFLFQSQGRITSSPEFSLHELIGSIVVLITPLGIVGMIKSFDPLIYGDIDKKEKNESLTRNWRFGLSVTLVPITFFIIFSIFREIKLSWTAPIWLAIVPIFALVFSRYGSKTNLPWYHEARLWPGMLLILLIFYGGFLHWFTLGLPGIPFPRESFMIGWQGLSSEFEELIGASGRTEGERPIIVGMDKYRVSSGLAFYRSKLVGDDNDKLQEKVINETTGRHLFGKDSLMYSYWHQPELFNSKDLIVVSSDSRELDSSFFSAYSGKLGPLESIMTYKYGKKVGPVYFRRLEGYKPRQSEVAQR
jgi:dolichol-phosphate mannosyltransferase